MENKLGPSFFGKMSIEDFLIDDKVKYYYKGQCNFNGFAISGKVVEITDDSLFLEPLDIGIVNYDLMDSLGIVKAIPEYCIKVR